MCFFLFADRESEIPELSAECEVFTVSICHKSALLEIQFAFGVDESFINIYPDYLGKEHGV